MGHLNITYIQRLAGGLADDANINHSDNHGDCRVCPMDKQSRQLFSKQGSHATEKFDGVHSDICGPMEVSSLGSCRYYIVFLDDKSRRMLVYFLKAKSESDVLKMNLHHLRVFGTKAMAFVP